MASETQIPLTVEANTIISDETSNGNLFQSNDVYSQLSTDERSNNATSVDVPKIAEFVLPNIEKVNNIVDTVDTEQDVEKEEEACAGQVNVALTSDSEDGFCVLGHSESDNVLEFKKKQIHNDAELNNQNIHHYEEYVDHRNTEDSSYTDSPGVFSQEELPSGNDDDDTDYSDSVVDDRISNIEEEYIQRIYGLEHRHYELEEVLARLAACLDDAFSEKKKKHASSEAETKEEFEINEATGENADEKDACSAEERNTIFHEKIGLELFVEFQNKLRNFAADLNGVLNCSEAAIRHARVVQQWATSVQIMFEQIKEERQKILNYIDERERSILVVKEQFIGEFQEQGKQLQQVVDEMNSYADLREKADNYCRNKLEEEGSGKILAEKIVDTVLLKRLEHEQSIMLSLNKQSKISELKLFIIHQQNCIQQLQEQNKELKAIIEGLMGPDDTEEEEEFCDTDQSGTPASMSSPDCCPVKEVLDRLEDSPLCLVSDVLDCDRGEYLQGTSTDGDIATIQTYNIGNNTDKIDGGENIVFDPLSVSYVRHQCQLAEETERQIHKTQNIVVDDLAYTDEGVKVIQDGMGAINIEPYLRQLAEEEDRLKKLEDIQEAAGDGIDKTILTSPNKNDVNNDISKREDTEQTYTDNPALIVSPPSTETHESVAALS